MKSVTLADVAAVAGVAGKTVSRVVNGEANVSAAVHARVTAAIAELGYRPNLAARALASSRPTAIGVVSRFDNSYFHAVHAQLAAACRRHGYHLIVEQLPDDKGVDEQIARLIAEVPLAGIVFTPGVIPSAATAEATNRAEVKTVIFSAAAGPADFGGVLADETQGEIALAEHLWALGHRRFAVFRMPEGMPMTRGQAFERHLVSLGLAADGCRSIELDFMLSGVDAGRRAAREMLCWSDLPSALFAFGDDVAAGAIGLLHGAGIDVPRDVSVVGFDDSEVAQAIWPALTTVRQPIAAMAEAAVAMLARRAESMSRDVICPIELILRASTARVRSTTDPVTPYEPSGLPAATS